jgi:uncharacterized membrane protein YbhN (UPF0104 family)
LKKEEVNINYISDIKCLKKLRQFSQKNSRLIRKLTLGVAAIFLTIGLAYSYSLYPDVLQNLHWQPITLIVVLVVPFSIGLSMVELKILAQLNHVRIPLLKALEITIIGSAANMLPLPGATIVRVAALKSLGSTLFRSTSSTILIGVIWIAVAFGYAGVWMLGVATDYISLVFIAIGILVFISSGLWWRKLDGSNYLFSWISIIKLLMVFIESVGLYLCFNAMGVIADFSKVSGLAVAGVLGSAVSIVPAGLGVREGVSAALSPIVGLSAALGFMAAFMNRLIGMSVIVPVATYLTLRKA